MYCYSTTKFAKKLCKKLLTFQVLKNQINFDKSRKYKILVEF